MLIHPWDAATDREEWVNWLATTYRFGTLAVNNLDPAQAPLLVPTHFTYTGDALLLHLARPNPIWPHLDAATEVRFAIIGDYAYVPSYWRANDGVPTEDGVPTSYYTAVHFVCRPVIVDDPDETCEILIQQLRDQQPEGGHAEMSPESVPYGRMLNGIRGIRLHILRVEAKFKYDDQKPIEFRARVSQLLRQRGQALDNPAATQQARRSKTIGTWKTDRNN